MILRFRPAEKQDSYQIWQWRNDPLTREMSRNGELIEWAQHTKWFETVLKDNERHLWIVSSGDEDVAVLRFDEMSADQYEISINVNPAYRGQGMGASIIEMGCRKFLASIDAVNASVLAVVQQANVASLRSFEKAGFEKDGLDENGWLRLVYKIASL
jgi:RimJ/RimL family protein N-acetyltransferase